MVRLRCFKIGDTGKALQLSTSATGKDNATYVPRSVINYMRTEPAKAGENQPIELTLPGWKFKEMPAAYQNCEV